MAARGTLDPEMEVRALPSQPRGFFSVFRENAPAIIEGGACVTISHLAVCSDSCEE